jgi:hypothetical protein
MKKRVSSKDLGMPAEFWGRSIIQKRDIVYVKVIKNGAVWDAFNCERSKIK